MLTLKKIKKLFWILRNISCLATEQAGLLHLFKTLCTLVVKRGMGFTSGWVITQIASAKSGSPEFYHQWISLKEVKFPGIVSLDRLPAIVIWALDSELAALEETINSIKQFSVPQLHIHLLIKTKSSQVLDAVQDQLSKGKSTYSVLMLDENNELLAITAAIAKSTSDYLLLVRPGVRFNQNTLHQFTQHAVDMDAALVYSDHDQVDARNQRHSPQFKPSFSLDLLRTYFYWGPLVLIDRRKLSEFPHSSSHPDAWMYELALLGAEKNLTIVGLPKILFHLSDLYALPKDQVVQPQMLSAISQHLKLVYGQQAYATLEQSIEQDLRFQTHDQSQTQFHCHFGTLTPDTLVSIIIPSKDNVELLEACINSILNKTHDIDYEIIIVDNGSQQSKTHAWYKKILATSNKINILDANIPFNWSTLNNLGIKQAKGDVLLFLNNDTEVINNSWLSRLAEHALREDVGTVGGLLLFADKTIQHAGIVVGYGGYADHIYSGASTMQKCTTSYVSPFVMRNVLACTGACLAASKRTLDLIGYFDETFQVVGSDVELSLRAIHHGLVNVYDPSASLIHYESKTRSPNISAEDYQKSARCYQKYLAAGDPYYNPNLSLDSKFPMVDLFREH